MPEPVLTCIQALATGQASGPVALLARLESLRSDKTRNGDPYLDLQLADLTGSIRAFLWSTAPGFRHAGELQQGDVLAVEGSSRPGRDAAAFHLQEFRILARGRSARAGAGAGPWEALAGRRLAFDIETVPLRPPQELPAGVAGRVRAAAEREGGDEGKVLSLSPLLGKVVCLAFQDLDDPGRALVLAVPQQGALFSEADPEGLAFLPGERPLLEAFWQVAAGAPLLVSFNGRRFDVPFLMVRAAIHGVAVTRDLLGPRFSAKPHLDLIDLVTCHGALRGPSGLEVCCHAFGIPTPKGDLDGSQVAHAYAQGRIEEIARYCLADTNATAELYRRLGASLLGGVQG